MICICNANIENITGKYKSKKNTQHDEERKIEKKMWNGVNEMSVKCHRENVAFTDTKH